MPTLMGRDGQPLFLLPFLDPSALPGCSNCLASDLAVAAISLVHSQRPALSLICTSDVHSHIAGSTVKDTSQEPQPQPFRLVMGQGPDGQSIPLGVISTTPHVCLLSLSASSFCLLEMSRMHGG